MFTKKEIVWCPVGKHQELGYRYKGQASQFVCRECGFIFSVDEQGNFLKPIKIIPTKLPNPCGCGGCGR